MILDSAISLPSLVALHLHIWDKRFLSARFWKPYAFIFFFWDWLFDPLRKFAFSGEPFDPSLLVGLFIFLVILLPLFIGVFKYAFKNWDGNGLPNKSLQATAAGPASSD